MDDSFEDSFGDTSDSAGSVCSEQDAAALVPQCGMAHSVAEGLLEIEAGFNAADEDEDSAARVLKGFVQDLIFDAGRVTAQEASDRLTLSDIGHRWPKYKSLLRKQDFPYYIKQIGFVRPSLHYFLRAERLEQDAPKLSAAQLFSGKEDKTAAAEKRRRRRRFRTTCDAVDACLQLDPALPIGAVYDEYKTQANIIIDGQPQAPPLPDVPTQVCFGDGVVRPYGDLMLLEPSLWLPAPTPGASAPVSLCRYNSVVRSAPTEAQRPAESALDRMLRTRRERAVVPAEHEQIGPIRPRYSQTIGQFVKAASGMWATPSGTQVASLRLIESGAFTASVPLHVEFDCADIHFGAVSFLLHDGLVGLLRSVAAVDTLQEPDRPIDLHMAQTRYRAPFLGACNMDSTADDARLVAAFEDLGVARRPTVKKLTADESPIDEEALGNHLHAFLAFAKLDPRLGLATALDHFHKLSARCRPRASQLARIEEHALWTLVDAFHPPGRADATGRTPRLTVRLSGLSPMNGATVAPHEAVAVDPGLRGVTVITPRGQSTHPVDVGGDVDACAFELYVPLPDRYGSWLEFECGPSTHHRLVCNTLGGDDPDSDAPGGSRDAPPLKFKSRYPPAAPMAREVLFMPNAWRTEHVQRAEQRAAAARGGRPTTLLSGPASLFDVDTLFTLLSFTEKRDCDDDDKMKARLGVHEALHVDLALGTLSRRRVDHMMRIAPDTSIATKLLSVFTCDEETGVWSLRCEDPKNKPKRTLPHGDDAADFDAEMRLVCVAARKLVDAPRFYDALFATAQLALCLKDAKMAHHRAQSETILRRFGLMWAHLTDGEPSERADELTQADWCSAAMRECHTLLDGIDKNGPGPATSHLFLEKALFSVNLASHNAIPELHALHEQFLLCPSGHFCTKDHVVYRWDSSNTLVCSPLRSSHRFDQTGISNGAPSHEWVADKSNHARLRTLFAVDYMACIAPPPPPPSGDATATTAAAADPIDGEAMEVIGDEPGDDELARPADQAAARAAEDEAAAREYARVLAAADELASQHPDKPRARRITRGLLRMFGYAGGIESLLFELCVTIFGMTELNNMVILTSLEDGAAGFVPGGGKTVMLKMCAAILKETRFKFLDSGDLNQTEGASKPNPGLVKALKDKAFALVLDEMSESGVVQTGMVNKIVSGNPYPMRNEWRGLFAESLNELIRVVTLWYASNYRSALARLFEGGTTRRLRKLIASMVIYVDPDSFAEFGNFPNTEAALSAFDGDDAAYARHMIEHTRDGAGAKRVSTERWRTRIESVGPSWHQVSSCHTPIPNPDKP